MAEPAIVDLSLAMSAESNGFDPNRRSDDRTDATGAATGRLKVGAGDTATSRHRQARGGGIKNLTEPRACR